jgi:hypothetical protein
VLASQYSEVVIINNIIAGHGVGITQTHPIISGMTVATNLLWNEQDPIAGAGTILADPLLTASYRPGPASPAVDAGAMVPWLDRDLAGEPRPQGAAYDIGAFEGIEWETFIPAILRTGGDPSILFYHDFQDGRRPGWAANHGVWMNPTENLVGYYPLGNAWYVHPATGVNFAYEGTVSLIDGNAAGLSFRASGDGLDSYDLILDAVDGVFKISKRQPYQVLAEYSMTVERARPYRLRIEAMGDMLFGFLDGAHVLTVSDTDHASGHFGLIVFQSVATFDDLIAWEYP